MSLARHARARRQVLFGLGAIGLGLGAPATVRAAAPLRVAAASDLQFALADIARAFEATSGQPVALSFGSSGNFARLIEQGAPFDLYMSADEAYVERLAAAGLTRDRGARYATGRITVIAPAGSPVALDARLTGLAAALPQRLTIANPEHAPYGRAAREALTRVGLWAAMRPRLVLGENIAQSMQYVVSGEVPAGIGALSLSRRLVDDGRLRHALIDRELHAPLHQRMVLIGRRPAPGAGALFDHLLQAEARAVFARHGFEPPDGDR